MTTGTVSSGNLTTLYSNTTSFTAGVVNSSVYSVNGGTGVTVNPTTGNVVVSIGQAVGTSSNVTFANVTATGNLSNNYYTLANAVGSNGQVLTTNGAGNTSWTTVSSLGLVNSVTGSGAGISVSPTTGAVIVSNTGVTSIVAGTNITVSSATGAVTINSTSPNGDVVGPAGATANAIARYDGTTGKLIKNSTVTLSDTNGITTTTGDLTLDAATDIVNVNAALVIDTPGFSGGNIRPTTNNFITISNETTNTSVSQNALRLRSTTTGTPAVGFGSNLEWEVETAPSVIKRAGLIEVTLTDITSGSEDASMGFTLIKNGAAIDTLPQAMTLSSVGDLSMLGDLTVSGTNINTGATNTIIEIDRTTTNTNIPARALVLETISTGTPAIGLGTSLGFNSQTATSTFKDSAYVRTRSTNITAGSESFDMDFGLMQNGAAVANKATLYSNGDFETVGSFIAPSIIIDTIANITGDTLTTTSTATVPLTTTTRNVMSGLVNIVQGANVHCVNFTVLKTGASTAMLTTYGEMYNTSSLASFTADTSSGDLRLLITPASATSTVFTAVRTALT
jgi:hypothetical protein